MHHKIFSEEFFAEFYSGSSEYSFDSDDVTLRLKKKDKKLSVIDSDRESESEAHGAGDASVLLQKSGLETTSQKLEGFAAVSGVTTKCNNPQSIREITINVWLAKVKITGHSISLCKNSLVGNELRILWL